MATQERSRAKPGAGRQPAERTLRPQEPGLVVASGPRALRQGTPETEESED